jgi:hypothetical protein
MFHIRRSAPGPALPLALQAALALALSEARKFSLVAVAACRSAPLLHRLVQHRAGKLKKKRKKSPCANPLIASPLKGKDLRLEAGQKSEKGAMALPAPLSTRAAS